MARSCLEVFLYDWWPMRGEGRLLDRLSEMPVRIEYHETSADDASRADWPADPRPKPAASPRRVDMGSPGGRAMPRDP